MSQPPEPVNVGVLGVGAMGRQHARVYESLPDAELVGVFDTNHGRAEEVADAYGTIHRDVDSLLADADGVSIAAPTASHYDLALSAIEAGVDVLIEKPFVDEIDRGHELIRAMEGHEVVCQVGHIERFNPAVRELSDITEGQDIVAIDAKRLGPPRDRPIRDSVVTDLMLHDLDVVLSLVNSEIANVSATSPSAITGSVQNDYTVSNLLFEDGIVASFTASRRTEKTVRELAVTTESCVIEVDYLQQDVEIHRRSLPEYVEDNGDITYRHEGLIEVPTIDNTEPLKEELRSFVDASRHRTSPAVDACDGLRVLEVANRIEAAAATVD